MKLLFRQRHSYAAIFVLLFLSSLASAQSPMPVDIEVPVRPTPFKGADGRTHLVYEMNITNIDRKGRALTVSQIDVLDDASPAQPIATFHAADLDKMMLRYGLDDKADKTVITDGARATALLWVSLGPQASAPAAIRQRFTLKLAGIEADKIVETRATQVNNHAIPVLAAPLRGGNWWAANGPSNTSIHRTALMAIDGQVRDGQRFAIDWIQFGDQGKLFSGEGKENSDYYAFGQDLLAVADATVVDIKDGIPENKPPGRAVAIDLDTIAGNYIILDLGNGFYAGYAHAQPGSLRVKKGDRVHRGDVLGKLGNTGNSDAPHLHFQVMDAPSIVNSEGLPYLIEDFTIMGLSAEDMQFRPGPHPRLHHRELPLENLVIRFP